MRRAFTHMKLILPVPDKTLTGLKALKAFQNKTTKDRRTFNRVIKNTRKGLGFGFSIFAPQRDRKEGVIFFDVGWTHPERFEQLEFTVFRYIFPDTHDGKTEMELCRSLIAGARMIGGVS